MTEPLADTWNNRDLPVLRTVVAYLDQNPGDALRAIAVANETGLTEQDVERAGTALRDAGLVQVQGAAELNVIFFHGISAEARRVAGSWPTSETATERLIAALEHLAVHGDTEDARSRARKILDGFAGAGHQIAIGVTTAVITGQLS